MPYNSVSDLPERIRGKYSPKAQRAFMHAFNSAWGGTCRDREDKEGCAFAVATAAAKKTEKSAVSKVIEFLKGLVSELETETEPETEETVEKATKVETPNMPQGDMVAIIKAARVVKADDELQMLYMPALVPGEEDSQEDILDVNDIREAAHRFMREYPIFKEQDGKLRQMGIGLDHADKDAESRDRIYLAETWLEKFDQVYETEHGPERIPAGTWMIGVHVPDKDVWESAKSGERTGASIEGLGERIPL